MRTAAAFAVSVVVAFGFTGSATGAPAPVKDGHYAGGGDKLQVFFDVQNRTIPLMRVRSAKLASCAVDGPAVFDSAVVGADGRFRLADDTTFPTNAFVVTGRFVSSTHVTGKIRWTTSDNCPAGVYKFAFAADRFAPVN